MQKRFKRPFGTQNPKKQALFDLTSWQRMKIALPIKTGDSQMYTFLLKPIKAIFVAVIALLLFVAAAPAANAQSSTRTITIKNTGSATIYDV